TAAGPATAIEANPNPNRNIPAPARANPAPMSVNATPGASNAGATGARDIPATPRRANAAARDAIPLPISVQDCLPRERRAGVRREMPAAATPKATAPPIDPDIAANPA